MRIGSLCVLLCACLALPVQAASLTDCSPIRTHQSVPLLKSLMQWIADNSKYRLINGFVPNLQFVSSDRLDHIANRELDVEFWNKVSACFEYDHLTIYLSDDFDENDWFDLSTLVHELVHFMQLINGKVDHAACPAALERNAYLLQVDYLDQHGYDWPEGLRRHLRLSAYVLSRCPPRHMR
jgi:hypothetical protein